MSSARDRGEVDTKSALYRSFWSVVVVATGIHGVRTCQTCVCGSIDRCRRPGVNARLLAPRHTMRSLASLPRQRRSHPMHRRLIRLIDQLARQLSPEIYPDTGHGALPTRVTPWRACSVMAIAPDHQRASEPASRAAPTKATPADHHRSCTRALAPATYTQTHLHTARPKAKAASRPKEQEQEQALDAGTFAAVAIIIAATTQGWDRPL